MTVTTALTAALTATVFMATMVAAGCDRGPRQSPASGTGTPKRGAWVIPSGRQGPAAVLHPAFARGCRRASMRRYGRTVSKRSRDGEPGRSAVDRDTRPAIWATGPARP